MNLSFEVEQFFLTPVPPSVFQEQDCTPENIILNVEN